MSPTVPKIPDVLLNDSDSTPTECALIHPYPGSMPAYLASRLVDRYSAPDSLVFDPFCGIGTVVLEALRLGRTALGADLLPLAVRVTNVAATLPSVSTLMASWGDIEWRVHADPCRPSEPPRAASRITSKGIETLRQWMHPHTFNGIVALKAAIDDLSDDVGRQVFHLVLAASLPSLSKRRSRGVLHWGWIADNVVPSPTDLIVTDPLAEVTSRLHRLFAFMRAVNRGSSLSSVPIAFECDWTSMSRPHRLVPTCVDLLLTSPPYPYSIDYALSTRLSGYLLDLPFNDLRDREIGARFKRKRKRRSEEYAGQIAHSLAVLGRTVRRGGYAVLVLPSPQEYPSIVPYDDNEWISFVLRSLGPGWRLEEWGARSYAARRVVPTSRPQRHDWILAIRRIDH